MYFRFWVFYYRSVPKRLKWKHPKTIFKIGNWIHRYNVVFMFNRFEFGINWHHLRLPEGISDKEK